MYQAAKKEGKFYRRAILSMAVIAVLGYMVAFIQADRATVHFSAYTTAYTVCFQHLLDEGAAQTDCNAVKEVRGHLLAHRKAFAVGEPFLNLALALTLAMILSPFLRKLSFWLLDLLPIGRTTSNSH